MSTQPPQPHSAESGALRGGYEPEWLDDGTPYSPEHGDVYYTRGEGLAESAYVFLEQNALAERWAALRDHPSTLFVIGETGFGTGLNFLLAWQLWKRCAPPCARLLFRSLESRPLDAAALSRALGAWPELAAESAELLAAWPPALDGLHHITLGDGRVTLQLWMGEAGSALADFADTTDAPVDAWFLDGFAPSRNPDMWRDEVLQGIAALTRPGGTLATFTAAAAVREGLARAGFSVRKVGGYGRKREMIVAERDAAPPATIVATGTPWHRAELTPPQRREALVIGAGIAGSCTARALAARGWEVQLLEASEAPATGASGNPQGILFTQLQLSHSAQGEFTLAAYLHATRFHRALLADDTDAIGRCGTLQLCEPGEEESFAKLQQRYAALPTLARFLTRDEASELAGVALPAPAIFLPASGWIDPRRACARALSHPAIHLQTGARVQTLSREGSGWTVGCVDGRSFHAGVVVLANALAATQLLPEAVAALHGIRGQITLLPEAVLPKAARTVLCGDGYVAPPVNGIACCGASFQRGPADGPATAEEQRQNLARVAALMPAFHPASVDESTLGSRVGERCASPDRLPLAGRVPDNAAFRARFAGLRDNARRAIPQPGCYLPGLALSIAHGSRGLCSAPLCAELVAAELSGEPLPVSAAVARALSPARFLIRGIIKGSIG
jgi:tRNA 5-methylaminomethyl-2-thiouridine biosynthesis bifunctional protein